MSTINGVLSSPWVTFPPEGVILPRVLEFFMGFSSPKNKIGGKRNCEKCLELPELARKLISNFSFKLPMCAGVDGGPSGGSSVHRPRSEDPHGRQLKFSQIFMIIITIQVMSQSIQLIFVFSCHCSTSIRSWCDHII